MTNSASWHARYVLYLSAGAMLVAQCAWLFVNIDTAASAKRFAGLLPLDETHLPGDHALAGYEHLAKWYSGKGEVRQVLENLKKKIELVGYPADYRRYSLLAATHLPAAEQAERHRWIFERLGDRLRAMREMGTDSVYAGTVWQYQEIFVENFLQASYLPASSGMEREYLTEQLRTIDRLYPNSLVTRIARVYGGGGDSATVADYLGMASALRSSPSLALVLGARLLRIGENEAAVKVLRRGYGFDTTSTLTLYYLALAENRTSGNPATIRALLERFLQDPPSGQRREAESARMMLRRLTGEADGD